VQTGACVHLKDLHAPFLVGQADLAVHLEPSRPQHRRVEQVFAVRHADQKYVVQLVDAVNLRQQLVHHLVAYPRVRRLHPARLHDH
jgi:hypothetical protein